MPSLLSRLAPLVISLRGSKRSFSSAARTLARVQQLREHPKPFAPSARLVRTHQVSRRDVDDWPIYTVAARDVAPTRHVVYLHGGCYVYQIAPTHWAFIGKLADEARVQVTVPLMSLAPDGTASSIIPRIAEMVQALVAEVGADNVSLVGDSSGGGMALAVAMAVRDLGSPPLHATVLISPWLDISGTDPRLAEIAPSDPWLAVPGTRAAGALYRAELPESDWRVSPIHGSLAGLGPVTVFTGTRDILNADAHRLLPLAAAADLALDFHEGKEMIHNYPILPMPEGDAARAVIVAAVR